MSYLKWDIGEISETLLLSQYNSVLFEHITMSMYYLCSKNILKDYLITCSLNSCSEQKEQVIKQ